MFVLFFLLVYCFLGVSLFVGLLLCSFIFLFVFGDLYIDVGNFVIMVMLVVLVWVDKFFYGMIFFECLMGCFSDGSVIVDFVGKMSSMYGWVEVLCVLWLFNLFNLLIYILCGVYVFWLVVVFGVLFFLVLLVNSLDDDVVCCGGVNFVVGGVMVVDVVFFESSWLVLFKLLNNLLDV